MFCRIYVVLISVTSTHFPDQPGLWFPSRAAAMGDREAFGSGPGDALQPWCSSGWRQSFPLHPLCRCCPSDTTTTRAESGPTEYKRSAMHIIAEGAILNTDLCCGIVESIQTMQPLTSAPNGDDDKTQPIEAQCTPPPPLPPPLPPCLVAKAKPELAPKPKV